MEAGDMTTGVAERLAECLKKKKTDCVTLGSLPVSLKRLLTGKPRPAAAELEKCATPHLGENLMLKRSGRYVYLALRQPDESLLLGILRKRAGKSPSANNTPFRKEEFIAVLNRLIEQGKILVRLNKDCKPLLFPIPARSPEAPAGAEKAGLNANLNINQNANQEAGRESVSAERFESAYRELEGGKFFVRVCDLRRRLGWGRKEFDGTAAALRDAGKIQLQSGDTAYFSERDIADSFIDENGFRMLTLMWLGRT
ncbi:MAG: hypothetical protein LBO82_00820 [Synergistaceae bacterium]|jgi:hypothetical protein|nr:hypothetical protein [Synergistaceae bacterium]